MDRPPAIDFDVLGGYAANPAQQPIPPDQEYAHEGKENAWFDGFSNSSTPQSRPENYFTVTSPSTETRNNGTQSINKFPSLNPLTEPQNNATNNGTAEINRYPSLNSPLGASRQATNDSHGQNLSSDSSMTQTSFDSPIERSNSKYQPLKRGPSAQEKRPVLEQQKSVQNEGALFRRLSRRRTNASYISQAEAEEENDEIKKLMSRMFGKARQEHSEEEKTRHSGVIFRDLTVKGVGLGASLQPTVGDIFMGLPRKLKTLFSKGAKAAGGKPPVRELLSHFDGCVRPGEMLLVLGRPGSGCSTFLKTFCNQREGYEAVEGEVSYGGTDAKTMKKDFRGEVIYNPEDDLHYATLSVKRTLMFALQTRTPGKESRLEGESRADYMKEFLRVVTKLFWIEHTLGTKVGDQFVRGVSGGEKKRVSIAEGKLPISRTPHCH